MAIFSSYVKLPERIPSGDVKIAKMAIEIVMFHTYVNIYERVTPWIFGLVSISTMVIYCNTTDTLMILIVTIIYHLLLVGGIP